MPTEPWKPESVPPKLQCAGSSSDVVDCPPGGRTKEGQPRRCCHWGAGLLLRRDHFHLLFTPPLQILLLLGGYCTGDNYRDERPIDVFVLNTSNYRWTEVLVPSSSHELLSNVHVAYWSTLVQTGQDMIYCPGRKTWGRGRASRMALPKVNTISTRCFILTSTTAQIWTHCDRVGRRHLPFWRQERRGCLQCSLQVKWNNSVELDILSQCGHWWADKYWLAFILQIWHEHIFLVKAERY